MVRYHRHMQVTIDIPKAAYHQLEAQASAEKTSVTELLADRLRKAAGLPMPISRMADRYPLIQSKHPDSINPTTISEFDVLGPSR